MDDCCDITVQVAVSGMPLPSARDIHRWAVQALSAQGASGELVVRIVDEAEMTALNTRYRGKDGPTNVLSFPVEGFPGIDSGMLGDIVICAPVVQEEALRQGKDPQAHWAHLVIHGVLHLLGFDHLHENEAREMESTEAVLLAQLGYPDPY